MYGGRIIIADNDKVLQQKLKHILTKAGYSVIGVAEDSLSALKIIRSRYPDLVILDSNLPGSGGFEVARIIGEHKIAPVIMFMPYYQKEIIRKSKDWHIFACLIKPIQEDILLTSIEIAFLNYEKILGLEKQVQELKDTLANRKIIEKAKGVLMNQLNISEVEAFKKIQKQSMNKRTSMKAVAEAILLAYDLKNSN